MIVNPSVETFENSQDIMAKKDVPMIRSDIWSSGSFLTSEIVLQAMHRRKSSVIALWYLQPRKILTIPSSTSLTLGVYLLF